MVLLLIYKLWTASTRHVPLDKRSSAVPKIQWRLGEFMLANLQELENSGDFEKGGLESRKSQNKRNQKKVSAVLYRSDD